MRLERTVLHKLGPFEGRFELDLTNVPGPLVAICASNGSGKTCLLESSFFGSTGRKMPTQGSLLGRAFARDSYTEQTFVNGIGRVTIRHLLDGVAKKGEAIVLDEHGVPLWESTSVKTFDAWAEKHLPSADVLGVTSFAVQGSSGFIGLSSGQRISIVLEATGVARIERAAAAARKEASRAEDELKALRVRIADAKEGAPDLETAEAAAAEYRDASALANTRATNMRAALAAAEAAAAARAELERQAMAARDNRERLERELQTARQRVQELGQRQAAADPTQARETAAAAEQALGAARATFAAAEEAAREASARRFAAIATHDLRETLERDVDAARVALFDLKRRVDNGRHFIEQAAEIRAAAGRLDGEKANLAAAKERHAAFAPARARLRQSLDGAQSRVAGIDRRIERARETLAGKEAADRAVAGLPEAEAASSAAGAAVEAAEAAVAALQGKHVAGAEERIFGLRLGVEGIIAEPEKAVERGFQLLDGDAAIETAARELPGLIDAAQRALRAAREGKASADRRLAECRSAAARAATIGLAAEDLATAEAERSALDQQIQSWKAEFNQMADDEIEALRLAESLALTVAKTWTPGDLENLVKAESVAEVRAGELATAQASFERLSAELAALPPAVELPPPGAGAAAELAAVEVAEVAARAAAVAMGAAEATRRELEPQVSEIRLTVERLVGELAAAPPVPEVPPAPDVARARAESESDDRVARDLAAEVARAEQRLEQAKVAAARAAELDSKRAEVEAELADWARLALDLGRDGIQSALVDAAGPELTELCNDLLRCHGTRYTVTVETKRAKADGKGETDECRVMVIDSVAGTEKEAKEHSGGEQTLLGEAISLALTMLACRRAGVTDVTLVRDESGAALDPANARAYVAMLRRAAAVVGARHVLLVTHDPLVQELCDHRIELPRKAVA